jgi:hypothetical protein
METPAPNPSRLKRLFRRTVFVLAVLITLVALLVAEENWRGSRAWRNYKSALEAKGERFDAARLIPPKVPDDENFAACEYLAHSFEKPPGTPGWTNIDSFLPTSYSLPNRPGWPYGLSSDLAIWAAAFQDTNAPEKKKTAQARIPNHQRPVSTAASEKLDPAQAAAIVLDHLKVCEPVLAELQAASQRRYCRFNVPYDGWSNTTNIEPASDFTLQHLALIKGLYRVLVLHAEAEIVADHATEALADINLMFRLDDGLKDEPLLISQLVRIACTAILLQPIAEGLAERRWSDAQLRSLQERLAQTDLLASTVQAFYGERDILENPYFRSGPIKVLLGWNRLEQLNINRAFQEVLLPRLNLARREVNPAIGHACDLAMSNYQESGVSRLIHHRIFASMLLPAFRRASEKVAPVQTDVDLLTVACALERYHLAEGSYPDQLNALSPRFITTLPHDIINGQPLKYRRTDNAKFVLYSVGWNGKDDGGVTATTKGGNPDRLQGDWVLEYPE